MENQIMEALGLLLTTVITGGIGVITSYVAIYLNNLKIKIQAETAKIKNEDTRRLVDGALDRLNSLIITNVMENTVKKELLESINDGKIDKSELKKLAEQVRDNVLKQLGDGSVSILNGAIGDLSGYLEVKIEEQLSQIKNQIA